MASTKTTSLGLNKWEASDKPVRQDFVNDNIIIDETLSKLNSDLSKAQTSITKQSGTFIAGLDWGAIQSGNGGVLYRLQLQANGGLTLYKSTDNGSTWAGKTITSYNTLS